MKPTGSSDSPMPKLRCEGMVLPPGRWRTGLDKAAHSRVGRGVNQPLTLIGKDRCKSVNKRRELADALGCSW